MSAQNVLRVAVIGAGPAGFYTSAALLAEGSRVDLYDKLPAPFGLVRFGVAPDHPKIKTVTRKYETTAAHERFRFFGGVAVGHDVRRGALLERYHAIVYAVGSSSDNRLRIPGEDLPGSHAAGEFVAWYNGHPAHADRAFDFSGKRAVVIGNGNVAVDVARMLALHPDELASTDMADHAIAALRTSNIREVMLLGRRGPAQAAFTNPELRELGELARAAVIVDPADVELDPASREWLDSEQAQASSRRNVDLLRDYANRQADRAARTNRVVLRFLTSPAEILGDERVEGIRVVTNRIEPGDDGRLHAIPTAATEVIPCGLVLRSIGYRGEPIDDVPFDDKRGLIHNDGGRVTDDAGDHQLGEYVAGWIKRGPSGVIGTNKRCADETIRRLLEDHHAGRLNDPGVNADSDEWLRDRVPSLVTWEDWERLDAHERSRGASHGRPRVKVVDIDAMTRIARGHGGQIKAAPA